MDQLKPSQANSPPLTPLGYLDRAAIVYGDCTYISHNTTTYTWSDTHSRCLRIASSIVSRGLGRGHVISVLTLNIPAMYELYFAVPMSGPILNNINTRLDPRTISVLLRHSGTMLIFVDFEFTSVLSEAMSLLPKNGGLVVSCAWKQKWNKFPAFDRAKLKARQGVGTLSNSEVNVIDSVTGIPVPKDGKTIGEVVLRGGCLFLGYLKDPDTTRNCMGDDGWFKTGDVGVMHQDGYLEIKDRSKDIIISGGQNISSVEVESVLYTFPGINEAAVVAKPDEYWGETSCAFVSLKEGVKVGLSEKDVIEYCRVKSPHYMVPKNVVFKDELPKSLRLLLGKFRSFCLEIWLRH